MGWLRLAFRLTAFVLFLAGTVALATALRMVDLARRQPVGRTPWATACFRWACRCLGLEIHQHGTPTHSTALFVSNHISWSDIPVLGSLAPIRFLSKAEVGQWPVIGWLAQQAGTLFINRGGGQARRVRERIADNLRAGENVLVFPEGTTSEGLAVLPFHGLLLAAAPDSDTPVQPVTIAYRRAGRPDHLAPFIGADEFQTHLLRLLREPAARVDVIFHPPVRFPRPSAGGPTTVAMAEQLRATVSDGLARLHDGRLDHDSAGTLRTTADPGQSRRRSLPVGQQSPDQSTG
ncbi:MAG: lysophospholipid acyltransferase family protein [Pseudomonadota bacterium]|nr:lysophospholipid acyltransferase family protein [Pseudomonadota bacterium]